MDPWQGLSRNIERPAVIARSSVIQEMRAPHLSSAHCWGCLFFCLARLDEVQVPVEGLSSPATTKGSDTFNELQ